MNQEPTPQAQAAASLRRALAAVAEAARLRLSGAMGSMVLSLLLHLLRRLDDDTAPAPERQAPTAPARIALLRAEAGLFPHPLSAHVDAIDLGLVAGWMMRGRPTRFMRPKSARRRPRHGLPGPARPPPARKNRSGVPMPCHALFVPLS